MRSGAGRDVERLEARRSEVEAALTALLCEAGEAIAVTFSQH
jgi:hypothetical protein